LGRARGGPEHSESIVSFAARRYISELKNQAILQQQPIGLDASALIPLLENFPAYASLLSPLVRTTEPQLVISALTLTEVLVHAGRDRDLLEVRRVRQAVLGIPGIVCVSLDQGNAARTALIRASTGLKIPDAAVIAAALSMNAACVIGNDRIWKNRELGIPYHHLDDILAME
jgi:hypothetical protein